MSTLTEHIVAGRHILSPATISAATFVCLQGRGRGGGGGGRRGEGGGRRRNSNNESICKAQNLVHRD